MTWPPQIGDPLPHGRDAWCSREKWVEWILADHGHGREWARVFRLGPDQWEWAWRTLKAAVVEAPVETVRTLHVGGYTCGVAVDLSLGGRTAVVVSAWHYAGQDSAPRLVTAYPTAYN